jgi:hypothetical protein
MLEVSNDVKFKVVTAANHDYFYSLLTLMQTFRFYNSTNDIFLEIWDLGLESWQRQILDLMKNDQIRIRDLSVGIEEPFEGAFKASKKSYAWKAFCVRESFRNCENLVWVDSGVAIMKNLESFFTRIKEVGYVFFDNFGRTNDKWTSIECKKNMGFAMEESESLQISANIFGLNKSHSNQELITQWVEQCSMEENMKSDDPNHRFDQSVLSILIFRRKYKLTPFLEYCLEGSNADIARNKDLFFLVHRRTFNWYDLNFLIDLNPPVDKTSPDLTIVTTTLNDLIGFTKTANSIPIHSRIEWIIVDGGSRKEIVHQIELLAAERSGQILYGPDSGIFHGMNKGLSKSRGKYVLFLNGGDCLEENLDIPTLLGEIERIGEGWGVGSAIGVNNFNQYLWTWPQPNKIKLVLGINSFCHQSTIVRKSVLDQLNGFREDSIYSDWAASLVLLKKLGWPNKIKSLKIRFSIGGVSSNQTIGYWINESSRLRVLSGQAILGNRVLDLFVQRILGQIIKSKRGQLLRPDLTK